MSGAILDFPRRSLRPDMAKVFALLDLADGDPEMLFATAVAGLTAVQIHQKSGRSPQNRRAIVNALALAFMALAGILGVPRGSTEEALSEN